MAAQAGIALLAMALIPAGLAPGAAGATTYGPQQTLGLSGLNHPVDVAVDAAGNVFVADYGNHRVVKVPTEGGLPYTLPFDSYGEFDAPGGVAVDASGNVFMTDNYNNRVFKLSTDGSQQTLPFTDLVQPRGIAVDGSGNVFVASSFYFNSRVVELPNGGSEQTLPFSGLLVPAGIAVDASGNVFVADSFNNRVVMLSNGSQQTLPFAGLNEPTGVAVDASGNVFVADRGNNRILELPNGGSQQVLPFSGLNEPFGVEVDTSGNVFVADTFNNRVLKLPALHAPGAPTNVTAVAGNGQATVAFSAPADDGGSPITSHTATCGTKSTTGATSPLVVGGLANGTPVDCTVHATNAIGDGPESSSPVSVTPVTVPGPPTAITASAGNGSATIGFSPPGDNGGSPITSHTATCGTKTATGPASPLTVTGLTNDETVQCTVHATNVAGNGPESSTSVMVTPRRDATSLRAEPAVLTIKLPLLRLSVINASATLTDPATNAPIADQPIRFRAGTQQLCTAVTNANGLAKCPPVGVSGIVATLLGGGYDASFAGTPALLPSSAHGSLVGG